MLPVAAGNLDAGESFLAVEFPTQLLMEEILLTCWGW